MSDKCKRGHVRTSGAMSEDERRAIRAEVIRHVAALVRMTMPGKWDGCIKKNAPEDFEVVSREEVVVEGLRLKATIDRMLEGFTP